MGHAAFFIVARFDFQRFVELRPQRLKLQHRFVKIRLKILCRGRKLAYSIFIRIVMSWPSCMVPSER